MRDEVKKIVDLFDNAAVSLTNLRKALKEPPKELLTKEERAEVENAMLRLGAAMREYMTK